MTVFLSTCLFVHVIVWGFTVVFGTCTFAHVYELDRRVTIQESSCTGMIASHGSDIIVCKRAEVGLLSSSATQLRIPSSNWVVP